MTFLVLTISCAIISVCTSSPSPVNASCEDDPTENCHLTTVLAFICRHNETAERYCKRSCGLCPKIDGGWSDWSTWSHCSVTCENGTHVRFRNCDNPTPADGGAYCVGNDKDTSHCSVNMICPSPCEDDPNGDCDIPGALTFICKHNETAEKYCKRSCGLCPKTFCEDDPNSNCGHPAIMAFVCAHGDIAERFCKRSCGLCQDVDGVWTEWSPWGRCSVSCGKGNEYRTRNSTGPVNGGKDCTGNYIESRPCTESCLNTITNPTTVRTTTAVTATTTQATHPTTVQNFKCHVCGTVSEQYCDAMFEESSCPYPYCVNEMRNDIFGIRFVTRRCGTERDCKVDWLSGTSDNDRCMNFDENKIYNVAMDCTYCCVNSLCNRPIRPDNADLYTSPPLHVPASSTPHTAPVVSVSTTHATSPMTVQTTHPTTVQNFKCHVCGTISEQFCDAMFEESSCPYPYCVNEMKNDIFGVRIVKRRCGTERDCKLDWLSGTSDNDRCMNFDENQIYNVPMNCTYCCVNSLCNSPIRPDRADLYTSPVLHVPGSSTPHTAPVVSVSTTHATSPMTVQTTHPTTVQNFKCHVCGTVSEQYCDAMFEESSCPYPYCVNEMRNDIFGVRYVQRRCGTERECKIDWLSHTSDNDYCIFFDENQIYNVAMNCTYCCVNSLCNRPIRPDNADLYTVTGDQVLPLQGSTTVRTTPAVSVSTTQDFKCYVCGSVPDLLCDVLYEETSCPLPYCVNTLRNDISGIKYVQRRCGTEQECKVDWLGWTSDYDRCMKYDETQTYNTAMNCTYCCVNSLCNKPIRPAIVDLYTGTP